MAEHDTPPPVRVYLVRRHPCWICSRSLMRVANGRNRGKFSAVQIQAQGHLHYAHAACVIGFEVSDGD